MVIVKMDTESELSDELMPSVYNNEFVGFDCPVSTKNSWDNDHITDNIHEVTVKEEEESDYEESNRDSTSHSGNVKSDKKKKLLTICVNQINNKEECEIKIEQHDDGECSYAELGSEQFSNIKTEPSEIQLPNSSDTIVPFYEVEIAIQHMKIENPDCEPVAVIILEKIVFNKRNFVCSVCFDVFTSLRLLKQHNITHDKSEFDQNKTKNKNSRKKRLKFCKKDSIKCDQCDYQSPKPSYLKRHKIIIHNGGKPFKCDFCDYKCAKLWNLKTHLMTHTGEKPFQCDLCDYKSARLSDFNNHKMNHSGEKAFKCDQCNYSTVRPSDLKDHQRTHSGVKPYSCNFCDLKFARSYHLKTHKMTHTGEKPFKCERCSYQSARSSDLKRHQVLHMIKEKKSY